MDKVIPDTKVVSGPHTCARCGKDVAEGKAFVFKGKCRSTSDGAVPAASQTIKCLRCALRHIPMLRRSLIAALFVGTVLTILNQSGVLLSSQWHNDLYWRIPLTYCVPFCVATYGAMINSRQ